MEELEQGPDTSFARDVVCEEEESMLLSTDNMKALRALHDNVSVLNYMYKKYDRS